MGVLTVNFVFDIQSFNYIHYINIYFLYLAIMIVNTTDMMRWRLNMYTIVHYNIVNSFFKYSLYLKLSIVR